jgi:hypothetical protein
MLMRAVTQNGRPYERANPYEIRMWPQRQLAVLSHICFYERFRVCNLLEFCDTIFGFCLQIAMCDRTACQEEYVWLPVFYPLPRFNAELPRVSPGFHFATVSPYAATATTSFPRPRRGPPSPVYAADACVSGSTASTTGRRVPASSRAAIRVNCS